MFKNLFSNIFLAVTSLSSSESACIRLFFDEPKMPKSMIEK